MSTSITPAVKDRSMGFADRLLSIPFIGRSDALRSFILGAWLGWQIESNWADPILFAIYSFARPIASVMILVVMYSVITDGATEEPIFAYIYLGNALYIIVGGVLAGISWAVIDDREHYRTAKQLYTSPLIGYAYLCGRGAARLIIGTISTVIVIVFGALLFGIPISFASIDLPFLLVSIALGLTSLSGLGLIIGAFSFQLGRNAWQAGELISGALYLFTGALFPLDILPPLLRQFGMIFPATYWLEAMRRALLGENMIGFPTFAAWTNTSLALVLLAMSVALWVAAAFVYRWSMRRAKEKGVIDLESLY
ncbi:MAG: ABC transporter permease [Chloroflexi bacterium]|nr:ABC transporter permease [Chloroflexota bacterium]